MDLLKPFNQIGKDDAASAGGKGASLGEMTQAGIPVPPGFVILADAFERFIIETDLIIEIDTQLAKVNHREMHTVENASETIQALILRAEMPADLKGLIEESFKNLNTEFVAVRSSATAEDGAEAAWAGQLDTYLNTTADTLLEKVQECWASLFTPRAIFYRFEKGMNLQKISVAVVVQKMVNSDTAGIAFSVHPVTEDRNQMIIEAGFGLGEAVVSGQVTPDSYVVAKEPRTIIDKNISEQSKGLYRKAGGGNEWNDIPKEKSSTQVLTDEQILALSEVLIRIENHYGFPVDTEWAMEAGHLYIVQSRPITTLSHTSKLENLPSIQEYELTFEGQGMPYIYEVALYTYYLPKKSVSIIKDGLVQEFMHKDTLAEMNSIGLTLTPSVVADLIKSMNDAVQKNSKEIEEILSKPLSESSVRTVFANAGDVTRAYYYFDPHFFDGIFAQALSNPAANEVVQQVQEYKNVAREYFNQVHFGEEGDIPQLLKLVSDTTGIAFEDLQNYDEDEIVAALLGNTVPENVVAARKELYVMRRDEAGAQMSELIGNEAQAFCDQFYATKENFHGEILRGKVAHAPHPITRGFVKSVTRDYTDTKRMYREMEEMKEGEILVTQTTDPEMMPALRKAAAAITDIGGMLSHTAITARELNIPCIVDTKYATEILHDGDEVEVDANAGIVRILTKQRELVYRKAYTRENCLIAIQIWEEHQCHRLKEKFGVAVPLSIFDAYEGVARVYYREDIDDAWSSIVTAKAQEDRNFIPDLMKWYGEQLDKLEVIWHAGTLANAQELGDLFDLASWAWVGLSISYFLPSMEGMRKEEQKLGMQLRERSADFLEFTDHVIQNTLHTLYPDLGDLIKYLTIEEVTQNAIPSVDELKKRQQHYIYYDFKLHSNVEIKAFLSEHALQIEEEAAPATTAELQGQSAMNGNVRGVVRVLHKKSEISLLQEGEILVTAMTTPDYLPAMYKAAAFITDEGGITCHAAIVARELGKPCVIGTKFATQLLHDGDVVEVDANSGTVRIIRKSGEWLSHKDYLLTFEGKGLRTLLSEIVSAGYLPLESLVFYQDETYKQYYSLKQIGRMGEIGKTFFADPGATKEAVHALEKEFEESSALFEKYKSPEPISENDIRTLFATFVRMNKIYGKFDFAYTDSAYESLSDNPIVKSNLQLVESNKNQLREEYNKMLFEPGSLFSLMLGKLSTQFSVPVEDLQWYVSKDLLHLYSTGPLSKQKLDERKQAVIFQKVSEDGELEFTDGTEATRRIEQFGTSIIEATNTIKGVTAHTTGRLIRGEVFVLDTNYGDFEQLKKSMSLMKEGQILVAPTTAPEHMDAIRKAAAIVVDVGGLLSHTAIVSRELGIPSIVGTQYATKIFKTGDTVEVDTDNGVVTLLKSYAVRPLQKEDVHIGDWEFEAQQRGEQPIFLCDLFSRALEEVIYDMTGESSHYDYLFTDSDKLNHSPHHRDIVLKKQREDMQDPAKRKLFLRNSIEIPKSFNAVADDVEAQIADPSVSNETLARLWREMDRDFIKVIPWFYYPWYVSKENMLTDRVKEGIEKYRTQIEKICDMDEALLALVFPVKKTNFQLEQDSMLTLATIAEQNSDFASDPAFKKEAAEYLKKYDWLTTFILTPVLPMTYEQLVERVRTAVAESFKENYGLQKETTAKNEERAAKLLEIVAGDAELISWIEDSRELGYVLTAGIEEAYMSSARYLTFIQLVSERIGVVFEDTKYLFSEEIARALEQNTKIAPQLVDERRKGFVLMMKDGIQYAAFGEEGHALSQWIDGELNKVDTSIREFTGQSACKGLAQGRVRIATTPGQAHTLKEGEILVCPMTNPDYVPAMRRSAAIITDEGGLLSHAAIMSREFGKPCVIGTKIATQLLKDGDLVEVNANEGIVRKLDTIVFKKSYSRDTTLFMQELWAKGLIERAKTKFGWDNPYLPLVAHYVNDGVVEIWEHQEAISWLLDKLLEENKKGPAFLEAVFEEYKGLLEKLRVFHAKESLEGQDAEDYADLIYDAAFDMTLFFYTGSDERSPKDVLEIAVKAREIEDFFAGNDVFVRKIIAMKAQISEELAGVVLVEELHSIPPATILQERLKNYLLIDGIEKGARPLKELLVTLSEYDFAQAEVTVATELRGQSAYKGVIQGPVRIVRKQSDMEKVLEGDILVSPMTTPDFLPAMLRAAAFVTDEGGVTCHAAIVAREMKKPCVIGTKVATQVLKDGDKVEVNATDGVVRILPVLT